MGACRRREATVGRGGIDVANVSEVRVVRFASRSMWLAIPLQHISRLNSTSGDRMEPPTASKTFSVAIIGGGLGGLTLAVGLKARGVSATVYEANDALRETGLGLSIGPAAHRALPLIDVELGKLYDSMVTTHADSPGLEHMRETWFQAIRAHGDQGGEVFTTLEAKPSGLTSVGRSEYLRALVNLLPKDKIKLAKTLTSLEVEESGVTLHFGDNSTETADIVIGCDGIKSKVKECLFPEDIERYKPSFSGMYVYRGVVDMDVLEQAIGPRARMATWHLAPRRYVIHYPISRATKVNMGCYIECPEWKSKSWVQQGEKEDLLRDFGDMTGPVQGLLDVSDDPLHAPLAY